MRPILLFIIFCGTGFYSPAQRPNVVMIVVDDMNGYGVIDEYRHTLTPYLDQLAAEGINFVQASCNAPVCGPSRASFFSGISPHKTGAYRNGCDPWRTSQILQEIESLPECFHRNGYETFGRGKIFHAPLSEGREPAMWDNEPVYKGGFGPFPEEAYWVGGSRFKSVKEWEGPDSDFPDCQNAEAAISFLAEPHEGPFFLYYGLWRPHTPYTAPKRFFDLFHPDSLTVPEGVKMDDLDDVPALGRMLVDSGRVIMSPKGVLDMDRYRRYLHGYCATTAFADWNVGRVIEALDASPYADNTLVIVVSDNGYHMGEKLHWQKSTLWDQADYVPFIVRKPEGDQGECKRTVTLLDIYPTLVDYCRLEAPSHTLDGHSIMPLLQDRTVPWDYPAFTSFGEGYATIRSEQYRYIMYPDGTEEAYDYEADPHEWYNIISSQTGQAIKAALMPHMPEHFAPSLGGRWEVKRK